MIDVRINNQSLRDILAAPPRITDQVNATCRTLDVTVDKAAGLENYLGQPVELWYGGTRWFFGFLQKRGRTSKKTITYRVLDPLFFFNKNPDDWYIKNMTATQGFKYLAGEIGIPIYQLANTGAVFPALFYQAVEPGKVAVDLLARTYQANGKKYWYRYNPGVDDFGLFLFERTVPKLVWAFQSGTNLIDATLEESIEELITVVKLVNRETGKIVTRVDADGLKAYGHRRHFEEANEDQAPTMEKDAQALLDKLKIVKKTMAITGVNPNQSIPQLYSGDVIYAEEAHTEILGGYHIVNITQEFVADDLVKLSMDIQRAPDVPDILYPDAHKPKEAANGTGLQQSADHNDAITQALEKYGLNKVTTEPEGGDGGEW